MAAKTRQEIPQRAVEWVRGVFGVVNQRVSETLSLIPTHHEPELDMQLIASLNQAPAVADVEGWTVYIQTHFLGGRRHFMNWEVADIGLLVIFRDRGKVLRIKVGLLQSKRLYPTEVKQLPDHRTRFRIGFATLLEDPKVFRKLAAGRMFTFTANSRYLALSKGSQQAQTLEAYQEATGIPVYYLFYNPVKIPWSATIPTVKFPKFSKAKVGCRIIPSDALHFAISSKATDYSPTYADLASMPSPFKGKNKTGWALEHFVGDELLRCKQGYIVSGSTDEVLERLFYNRSGPISAAIAVTIEAPRGIELALPDSNVLS